MSGSKDITKVILNGWIYGATTARTDILLDGSCQYLGICLKPELSYHLFDPVASLNPFSCTLEPHYLILDG